MLFQFDHYRGRRMRLNTSVRNLGASSMKNKGSSICVPPVWTVQLFRKTGFRGKPNVEMEAGSEILTFPDFVNGGPDPQGFWNDRVVSIRVTPPR